MLSRARPSDLTSFLMVACLGLLVGACATGVGAVPQRSVGPRDENIGYEFRIRAENDRGDRLLLLQQPGFTFSAEVSIDGEIKAVAPGSCAGLDQVLADFVSLPPLAIGPWSLRHPGEGPLNSIPPRRVHAPWWTVEWAGEAPDGSLSRVEMDGDQGPYVEWLDRVVGVIKACP